MSSSSSSWLTRKRLILREALVTLASPHELSYTHVLQMAILAAYGRQNQSFAYFQQYISRPRPPNPTRSALELVRDSDHLFEEIWLYLSPTEILTKAQLVWGKERRLPRRTQQTLFLESAYETQMSWLQPPSERSPRYHAEDDDSELDVDERIFWCRQDEEHPEMTICINPLFWKIIGADRVDLVARENRRLWVECPIRGPEVAAPPDTPVPSWRRMLFTQPTSEVLYFECKKCPRPNGEDGLHDVEAREGKGVTFGDINEYMQALCREGAHKFIFQMWLMVHMNFAHDPSVLTQQPFLTDYESGHQVWHRLEQCTW